MNQVKLKFEYLFIIELIDMLGDDRTNISYVASYLAGSMEDEDLPAGVPWDYPIKLAVDCIAVLKGSGCPRTLSGVRSALHVYRRGNSGVWLESWQY